MAAELWGGGMTNLPQTVELTLGDPPMEAIMSAENATVAEEFPETIVLSVTVPKNPRSNQQIVVQRNALTVAAIDQLMMPDLVIEFIEGTCGHTVEYYRRFLVGILVKLRRTTKP